MIVDTDITYTGYPEVTLEDVMGDDLSIVNAARVSFAKRSSLLSEADKGLIGYLMRERHGTPFEMVQFCFRIRSSIRVLREWQRHRIGSFNEQSTRYVEMEPVFFVPEMEAVRVQTGKPGHYIMEQSSPELAGHVRAIMKHAYENAWHDYQVLIESGVAKEVAAYVLPLGTYSEQIWSVNLRALFNFLSLRNDASALREIREAAVVVEDFALRSVPVAMKFFNEYGRHSP